MYRGEGILTVEGLIVRIEHIAFHLVISHSHNL